MNYRRKTKFTSTENMNTLIQREVNRVPLTRYKNSDMVLPYCSIIRA